VCKKQACAGSTVPRSASGASIASAASFGSLRVAGRASHWDAVRAHFLYRRAASAAARDAWYAAVEAAQAAAAQLRAAAAAEATQQRAQPAQQAATQPAVPAPVDSGKAAGDASIAIRVVASAAAAPSAPSAAAAADALATAAEDKAARRRALATTSYRRLTPSSAKQIPKDGGIFASMRGTLQQMSVH